MTAVELRNAGISPSAIEIHKETFQAGGQDADLARPSTGERSSGFWSWLVGDEASPTDHTTYDRTIAAGGAVLSVVASDLEADKIYAIIEKHHPADLDERSSTTTRDTVMGDATAAMAVGGTTSTASSTAPLGAAAMGKDAETIALAEEQITVGKRQVEGGTARIRRYVIERPVEEQIKLRTESLRVERRPVSAGVTVAADAFTDKIIEVKETAEEAVVGKTTRVVEEVVIGKDVSERTETVHDTVRREEIEVTKAEDVVPAGVRPAALPKDVMPG